MSNLADNVVAAWPPERILDWLAALERADAYPPKFRWDGLRESAVTYMQMDDRPAAEQLQWGRVIAATWRAIRRAWPFFEPHAGYIDGHLMGLRLNMIAIGGPDKTDPLRDVDTLVDAILDGRPHTAAETLALLRAGQLEDLGKSDLLTLQALDVQGNLRHARRAAEAEAWLAILPEFEVRTRARGFAGPPPEGTTIHRVGPGFHTIEHPGGRIEESSTYPNGIPIDRSIAAMPRQGEPKTTGGIGSRLGRFLRLDRR